MNFYKQKRFWLLIAITIFLINQLPFLTDVRPVMYDEAWYANTAYNFSQGNGFLNSVVGSRGNSNYLLPTLTGIMFWVCGYSLFTIRLTAVLCGVVTLVLVHLCLKELKSSKLAEIAVLMLFVSVAIYNTIFRFGRPECVSIMCMAGGVLFFLRYLKDNSWKNMLGLSFFTFTATIAHPYALLFSALAGTLLLYYTYHGKKWINLAHLILLLFTAIAAIGSIAWVSYVYNGAEENYVSTRFSISNVGQALPVYFKSYFLSKHTIYMLPILLVIGASCRSKDSYVKPLALIALVYFAIFPFLFSTDLAMVGLGGDYVMLLGTLLLAPCFDKLYVMRYKKIFGATFGLFCLINLGLSYYYNYVVKYEKCNTVLQQELQSIIPEDAIVYTSIRQYPLLLKNTCFSDHYCKELPISYDYIVLNSQDANRYDNSVEVQKLLDSYVLIFKRETKQYGQVRVYKNITIQ